jgi:hypothetical protein
MGKYICKKCKYEILAPGPHVNELVEHLMVIHRKRFMTSYQALAEFEVKNGKEQQQYDK